MLLPASCKSQIQQYKSLFTYYLPFSCSINLIPYTFLFLNDLFLFLFDWTWQHNLDIWKFDISLLGIFWGNSFTLNNSKEVDNWWATAFHAYVKKIKDLDKDFWCFYWNWCQIIIYFVLRKGRSYNQAKINNKS